MLYSHTQRVDADWFLPRNLWRSIQMAYWRRLAYKEAWTPEEWVRQQKALERLNQLRGKPN
ncbi:hypothetical protein GCM10023189_49220 [Nibrella saemangeumensis]|uniref:Uncharacterized protein n=1 Tax=Nibrella saemangeumensis TaxID=1084526 RepID=A0ABP8NJR2_9BACT